MKPAPFDYYRARTLNEALYLLAEHGDEAKVLAGGQSLVPMMNLRLTAPAVLIDVGELSELRYIRSTSDDGTLVIGALTRHADFEGDHPALAPAHEEAFRAVARLIGHTPIRVRGTFGGSLAHADPVAEWCVLALAAGATVDATTADRARTIPVDDFFEGFFTTALEPEEIIRQVEFPLADRRLAFAEVSRRHGDFALVATAASASITDGGAFEDVRLAVGGVGSTPVRLEATERLLAGQRHSSALLAEAIDTAGRDVEPHDDIHATAAQRRAMTGRLVGAVLGQCVASGPTGE